MNMISPVGPSTLSRYVSYVIDFCEEVSQENIEKILIEIYETICTTIELMSDINPIYFNNPTKSVNYSPNSVNNYDLIRLVPRDSYCTFGSKGDYSIIFQSLREGDPARIYTSHASVFSFALISCFLKHLSSTYFGEYCNNNSQNTKNYARRATLQIVRNGHSKITGIS